MILEINAWVGNLFANVPEDEEQWFKQMAQRIRKKKPMAIDARDGESWKLIAIAVS